MSLEYRPCVAVKSSTSASAWVVTVTETTRDGVLEQPRFASRPYTLNSHRHVSEIWATSPRYYFHIDYLTAQ